MQQNFLDEIIGLEGKKVPIDKLASNPNLRPNELNLMTMHDFEDHFIQEITEKVSQADVLTVRDIKKIRELLGHIHRHILRLKVREPTPDISMHI